MTTAEAVTKGRILVVDDIPDTVELLKDWLTSHHYDTLGVTSGLRALDVAAETKPDLILLDVMMPKMDGMETCRRLKANPATASIPVILVTARNPSDARAEGMLAGAIDYITKPVNLNELVARIEIALSRADQQTPVDVQRLLEEVAHSALAIMGCDMVWLLGIDAEITTLRSRILVTTGGQRQETDFLVTAGQGEPTPSYLLDDARNPLCHVYTTRKTEVNLPTSALADATSMVALQKATDALRLGYLTAVPITAAGKTSGVMVLGSIKPVDMETQRTRQIVTSLASQAVIALDYSRLILDLTDREREMRREQAFRQMVLDTMSDGLVVIDSKGIIKYVNRRLLRLTDYPKGYLEGRSVGELFHADDRIALMVGLLREGGATMRFDQRLMTKDNRVINVWMSRSRSQTDDLENQVIVLSDMTEQREKQEELELQTRRLGALNKASHIITAKVSLHDTLQNILDAAMSVVEAQGASLFLFNRDNPNELIVVAAVGTASDIMQGLRVPVGQGVAGWVAREAKSELVSKIERDPRFFKGVDEQTGLDTRSLIAVPLISGVGVIGVIEVVNKLEGEFTQDDVKLLESMAGTAAISVENARLFDETRRRVKELGTLFEASSAASSTLEFSQVIQGVARNIAKGLEVARCTILSLNDAQAQLETLAEQSDTAWPWDDAPHRLLKDHPLIGQALQEMKAVQASLNDGGLSREDRLALTSSGMGQMIYVPQKAAANIHLLVNLYYLYEEHQYSEGDIQQARTRIREWLNSLGESGLERAGTADLRRLADRLMVIGPSQWVHIYAWKEGEDFARLLLERGFSEWTTRPGISLKLDAYPTLQAVIRGGGIQMHVLDDLKHDPQESAWISDRGGRACMLLPLMEKGKAVGLIKLIDQDARKFDEGELRLAQGIANVVTTAIVNAQLYQSLDNRARALESAYRELQQSDKAKDEFIQNVSHELRTPLISILGYGGLMAEGDLGEINAGQKDALDTMMRKAQQLAQIVEDIVSAIATERTFEQNPVDLHATLQDVIGKHTPRMTEQGIKLQTHFPAIMEPVQGDGKALAEAIDKLLDNALKFGASGGQVAITVEDPGGPTLQVSIRDQGIGIPENEHQKIFQRFYQVDGSSTRRFGGTGLGLAIARTIIEGHSGRIDVQSKPGAGATFVVTLPKYDTLKDKGHS
jgi:PAS domain S-box-containing protein